jgi:secondary thiamine-phosphate synthase enzyme
VKQHTTEIVVTSHGPGMIEFTDRVVAWVRATQVATGLLTLHVKHTSASLLIQENADAEVRRDFERFLRRLVPEGDPLFRHTSEGPDDMPAHVRAALTATTLSIPVVGGAPTLGTWQGIYLYEHRTRPHTRKVAAHLIGE